MADDTLVMNGKTYISSAGAADLVGYTKDYVGQLARAGKLDAKLIGRSWYISKDSILEHKGSVNYTLTKPKKARKHVSHVTKKANVDIENSSVKGKSDDPETAASSQATRADKLDPQETVDISFATIENARSEKSSRSYNQGSGVLIDADIEFEPAEPLFYEDDRPIIPEPRRVERVEDAPTVKPRLSAPIHSRRRVPAIRTVERRSGPVGAVSVDGVRVQKSPLTRKAHRSVPHEHVAESPKSHPRRRMRTNQRPSKAVPVLGSIGAFVVFVVWYLVSR